MKRCFCAGSHLAPLGSAKFVSLKNKISLSGSLGSWRDTIWSSSGMWPEQGPDWTLCAPVIGQNHMPGPAGKSWLLSGRLASQNGKLMPAWTPVYGFSCQNSNSSSRRVAEPLPFPRRAYAPSHLLVSLWPFPSCVWLHVSMCSSRTFPPAPPSLIYSSALGSVLFCPHFRQSSLGHGEQVAF